MRVRHVRIVSACAASRQATCPSTRSACPVIAFVSDTTAKSAPSASGCCNNGVAVVLSTTTNAPAACAASASAAMSHTSSAGLVGDSSHSTAAPVSASRSPSPTVGAVTTRMPCAANHAPGKSCVAITRVV